MGIRNTKAEKLLRIEFVYERIIDGFSRAEIIKAVVKKGWTVTDRTVDNYIAAATQLLREASATERNIELSKARRRLNKIFRQSHSIGDYKTCLNIQQEINKLNNLYPDKHFGIDRDVDGVITGFTIEEIIKGEKSDADNE